jgi:hypothetical protein
VALGASAFGFGVATVALLLYTRRLKRNFATALQPVVAPKRERPRFQSIRVDDERLKLFWIIRQSPETWLNYQDVQHRLTASAVHEILDGPFHTICQERLDEERTGFGASYSSPVLIETCPNCDLQLFTVPRPGLDPSRAFSWTVRAQAVQELQRMHRNGTRIKGPRLTLERPLYWNDMLPPAR